MRGKRPSKPPRQQGAMARRIEATTHSLTPRRLLCRHERQKLCLRGSNDKADIAAGTAAVLYIYSSTSIDALGSSGGFEPVHVILLRIAPDPVELAPSPLLSSEWPKRLPSLAPSVCILRRVSLRACNLIIVV